MSRGAPRIIFMGTPEYAVPFLEGLIGADLRPVAVFSQPDRPVGRKQTIEPTPVKRAAHVHGVPVFQPEDIRSAEWTEKIRELQPDLIVVVAFGQIIPKEILDIPPIGCVNVHPSLLPKYRGAAPLQEAILSGDTQTGVTIMRMDEKMDHGPILLQEKVCLAPDETLESLQRKTIDVGVPLLLQALEQLEAGTAQPKPQVDSQATYTRLLTRKSGKLNFSKSALELERMVRALNPWPGTWFEWRGKKIKILTAQAIGDSVCTDTDIGKFSIDKGELVICCASSGYLKITHLQIEGKSPLSAREFFNGYKKFLT